VVIHKHTQYPGPGRTNTNVVGYPVGPVYAAKAGGFFFIVFGVIAAISAAFTINPIWNYGPYDPSPVSAGTQPDWYIGWVDGALRLMPGTVGNWDFEWNIPFPWGVNTLSMNVLFPALIPAGIVFTLMLAWPWIESWVTKDNREHHLLDRPRNAPTRTAVGVAGVVFYCVMWAAASSDLIATHFLVSLNDVTYWLRILVVVGPIIGFMIARRVALALQRKDREIALHGRETGRIVRLPHGEFIEVHEPVDEYRRYQLVSFESPEAAAPIADANGHVSRSEKLRSRASRFFFEDRVAPVTPSELNAAHSHGHHGELAEAQDRESIASR
jgi:ubiquinol-cytochrome c reductase cytochrome b subunit